MKSVAIITAAALIVASLSTSCQLPGGGKGDEAPNVTTKSIKLSDSNGHLLGYVFEMRYQELRLCSKSGYFVWIDWAGYLINPGSCFYTEADGQGIMFCQTSKTHPMLPNWILTVSDGMPCAPKYSDSNGFIATNPAITGYKSKCIDGTTIINEVGSVSADTACEMKQMTMADIGFPNTITLPLILKFE